MRRIEKQCGASPRLRAGSGAYPGRAPRFTHRLQLTVLSSERLSITARPGHGCEASASRLTEASRIISDAVVIPDLTVSLRRCGIGKKSDAPPRRRKDTIAC